ncbi:RluA family pseudouridine synthase [Tistrella bauzanensis]
MFAKTDAAHLALARQFAEHTIRRAYTAVVWGVPGVDPGRIEGNIGRHPVERQRMSVVTRGGKPAVTHYRIANTVGLAELGEEPFASVLDCRLETGRTHQIRVHLTHIGHPLVGDPVYGRSPARLQRMEDPRIQALCRFPRQALHARRLGFVHPITGRNLRFESQLPADMRQHLESLDFF